MVPWKDLIKAHPTPALWVALDFLPKPAQPQSLQGQTRNINTYLELLGGSIRKSLTQFPGHKRGPEKWVTLLFCPPHFKLTVQNLFVNLASSESPWGLFVRISLTSLIEKKKKTGDERELYVPKRTTTQSHHVYSLEQRVRLHLQIQVFPSENNIGSKLVYFLT